MSPRPLFVSTPARLDARPSLRRASLCGRAPPTCCAPAGLPPTAAELDGLFARLTHVNKNLRRKASAALASHATDATVARLVSLLREADTGHRRAAVQALGMTGVRAVPRVVARMTASADRTERASCAKMLASVALFFPEARAAFPAAAMDALERALADDPDPVTKLASVGCLATVGSDSKPPDGDVLRGNDRAVDILISLCGKTQDMAVCATAVGAVAQIAQNGSPERKARIADELAKLCEGAEPEDERDEDGFSYVREMARTHLEQLQGGTKVPE